MVRPHRRSTSPRHLAGRRPWCRGPCLRAAPPAAPTLLSRQTPAGSWLSQGFEDLPVSSQDGSPTRRIAGRSTDEANELERVRFVPGRHPSVSVLSVSKIEPSAGHRPSRGTWQAGRCRRQAAPAGAGRVALAQIGRLRGFATPSGMTVPRTRLSDWVESQSVSGSSESEVGGDRAVIRQRSPARSEVLPP